MIPFSEQNFLESLFAMHKGQRQESLGSSWQGQGSCLQRARRYGCCTVTNRSVERHGTGRVLIHGECDVIVIDAGNDAMLFVIAHGLLRLPRNRR